jgi:outer membrane receptor protein involved in Fe transport
MDSYNTGRVDIQRGPNAVLFGIGSPAGIVNSSLNTAEFRDSGKLENQIGSYGSVRYSLDVNQELLKKELALRVSALRDDSKYRQDPAFRDDHRIFLAGKWDPSVLNSGSAHSSLRISYENGKIDSNMPYYTPPIDGITPWFANLNKATYDAATVGVADDTQPWLGIVGNRVYDSTITAFNGGRASLAYPVTIKQWPGSAAIPPALVDNGMRGIRSYDSYAGNAGLPFQDVGPYKAKSLTDPSIYNFYTNLLEGPNKHEFNDFDAVNVTFSQTFFNDKLGFELAYDRQNSRSGYQNFISTEATMLTVDIMKTLPTGEANPNVGRPMFIGGGGGSGGGWDERTRDVRRATAFGELNFADHFGANSWVARVFGRNTFTGLLTRQKNDDFNGYYSRYYLGDSFLPYAAGGSVGQSTRDSMFAMYLGNALTGTSASGANLGGLKNIVEVPASFPITLYNNVTNAWQSVPMEIVDNDLVSDTAKTYRGARKNIDTVTTSAAIWQGHWFDDVLVPMVGIRKDSQKFRDAGNVPVVPANAYGKGGLVNPFDPAWVIPDDAPATDLTSRTYSIVAHLPKSLRNKMPGKLDVSLLYNQSENFKPDSGRRDVLGNPVSNPKGDTKEYGITITALDDKLSFKVVHYKTTVTNATLNGGAGINNNYLIGAVEAWGQSAAINFKNSITPGGPLNGPANVLYGTSSDGHQVTWRPDGALKGSAATGFTYSQAELDATYAKEKASIDAWFGTQVPASFQQAWALTDYATGGGSTNYGASGLVVTGTTVSEGYEFELIANPVRGLNVMFNASKTSAQRTDLAQPYISWITKRWAEFQGPAGDMRLWNGADDYTVGNGQDGETARAKYGRETMTGYNLFRALEGSDVPELKPWSFNVIASYDFVNEGRLHGSTIGASYRWQDKSVTGFPVVTNSDGVDVFDVAHPYMGDSTSAFDLWLGYERNLTRKLKWRIQLNIRNAFADDKLIPVTVQPDGSPGAYRIPEPRTWTLTNTLSF